MRHRDAGVAPDKMKIGRRMLSISPSRSRGGQGASCRSAGISDLKDYFWEVELYGR